MYKNLIISNRYRDGGNFLNWNYFISFRKTIEALGMKFKTFNDMVISYANTCGRRLKIMHCANEKRAWYWHTKLETT